MKAAGLFETILVRDGSPIHLDGHLDRLRRSALSLSVPGLPGLASLRTRCRDLATGHGPAPGRMRVALERGLSNVSIEAFPGYPTEIYEIGVEALLAPAEGHPLGELAGHKVLPYDRLLRARECARSEGAFEVVFRDRDASLLEGSFTNLILATGGVLRTPPLEAGILPGVTRAAVIRAAGVRGIAVREETLRTEDLAAAEEAFLTASLMEVVPLRRLGEASFSIGALARDLLADVRGGG